MRALFKSLLCIPLSVSILLSQSTISGLVLDGETESPIAGANVTLKGTNTGAAANDLGVYSIMSVEAGSYTVIASAIGYDDASKAVVVDGADPIKVNFNLTPGVIELDPVMVLKERSSLLGSSHNFLRIPGAANVVTAGDLERFNDSDIIRIIARIPGVYVQEEDGYGLGLTLVCAVRGWSEVQRST